MIVVHHLEASQSFRIVWLLEELEFPYDIKLYKRTEEKLAPPEYKVISPLGTSPTITDGDLSLSESNAIIEYILDQYEASSADSDKALRPQPGSPERTPFLFWFHSSAASFMPVMTMDTVFREVAKQAPCPVNVIMKAVSSKMEEGFFKPKVDKIMGLAEQQLQETECLAGNSLTAADITIIYSFEAAFDRFERYQTEYPACWAWYQRMLDRPAVKAALKKVNQETIAYKTD